MRPALASVYTPDEFEKKQIYLAEYPTVVTALGRMKPGVNQDIINQINQGILVFKYVGHGRQDQLAHEDIFDLGVFPSPADQRRPVRLLLPGHVRLLAL